MKLVEASRTEVQAHLIIGNGQMDERIFGTIASKFDHSMTISNPLSAHETGLSAAFKAIAKLVERVKPLNYLIVIDKEHMEKEGDPKKLLGEYGFELQGFTKINEFAYKIKAKRGDRVANIYIALNGFEKCIEESIVKLIEKLYGEKVEPSKEAIRRWLKVKNKRDIDLIESSTKETLEEAFPGIVTVIKNLVKDICDNS